MPDLAEVLTRKAPAKSTWDAASRTLEVRASTFADVERYRFVERLSGDPSAWDLSRVSSPAGVPLLNSHNSYDLNAKLGVVTAAQVRRDGLHVTVKLSETEATDRLVRDIEAGIGAAVSIGYSVTEWLLDESGDTPIRTATAITLLEVSVVSVAADPGAAVRSLNTQVSEAHMPDAPAQREFTPEMRAALVERHGLNGPFLRQHANAPEIEFRAAVMDAIERRQERTVTAPMVDTASYGRTINGDTRAIADALMVRIDPRHKPADESRQFVGLTVTEIARHCLEAAGQRSFGTPSDVIGRALHSTSDFPVILENVLGKSLAASYQPAAAALKAVARQTTARDFRDKHRVRLSEGSGLEKVNESGEFKRGTFAEGKEKYRLATFGKVFGITRQALINDDLGAFTDIPSALARTAGALEAKTLADVVVANAAMSDGKALFHVDHGNLITAAALSTASLTDARKAMRAQVGLAGELISVTPKCLVVGPALETQAEQLLASITATKSADVNPFSGRLELIVEPRLAGIGWYVAASPNEIDGLEYAYLEGQEGPQVESRAGFDVDGLEVRVRLDFAAAFTDHRGWVRNPGT